MANPPFTPAPAGPVSPPSPPPPPTSPPKPISKPIPAAPVRPHNVANFKETVEPLPNNFEEITIEGKTGDPITRWLDSKYPLASSKEVDLKGYDRYHLAGPNATGDERGIVYASKKFNISETAEIENVMREARARVESAGGGDVYVTIKAIVKNWKDVQGVTIKVLKEIQWKIEVRLAGSDSVVLVQTKRYVLPPPRKFPQLFKGFIPKGTVAGIGVFAGQVILSEFVHKPAVEQRIIKQTEKEGYVSFDAPSEKGLLYDIGAWVLDPFNDAEYSVGIDKRFNIKVWRERLRNTAAAKQIGETMEITWEVVQCEHELFGRRKIEKRTIVYRKQPDGSWKVEKSDASGMPDLNWIISEKNSDSEVQSALLSDKCAS